MSEKTRKTIAELMMDNEGIEKALGEAVQETVREHKLLGYPIVVWRDGQVVWVPPEEIELEDDKPTAAICRSILRTLSRSRFSSS